MSFEQIRLEIDGAIGRIFLHRPDARNAMTPAMGREVRSAVETLNGEQAVRVVIIRGAGKAFCAGADLRTLGHETGDKDDGEGLGGGENFYRLFLSIRDLQMPSIAAINGHAIGAGMCFALAADMRVMRRGAKVGLTFVKLGIHPGMAASWNLPRLIGPAQAADLLYTGRLIEADEAFALGLVSRVGAEDFDEVVEQLASEVATSAPLAVRGLKETLRRTHEVTIDEAIAREASVQEKTFQTADAAEGIAAILAKRRPNFQGR